MEEVEFDWGLAAKDGDENGDFAPGLVDFGDRGAGQLSQNVQRPAHGPADDAELLSRYVDDQAIAGLIRQAGYERWKGHDMQARAYDNTEQAINRVIRSVLSWEACAKAAKELKTRDLMKALTQRDTATAEDMMRAAVVDAQKYFDEMYK